MEITGIDQSLLRYDMADSFRPAWKPGFEQTDHEVLLFELETDTDISGVATASGFAGRMDYLELAEMFLVGEDPREIESLVEKMDPLNLWGPRPWHFEVALGIVASDSSVAGFSTSTSGVPVRHVPSM
ncbi:hypothetical protein [Natrinema longum]|uniref:hypothetical protein n=1 Tax=Natrinema longum TaxID=370324 RepID=UPI001CC9F6A0|nr:hypothetical protein [Natrinema longum]MBZ6496968.1 hypothetical protein [Natrinema longum]